MKKQRSLFLSVILLISCILTEPLSIQAQSIKSIYTEWVKENDITKTKIVDIDNDKTPELIVLDVTSYGVYRYDKSKGKVRLLKSVEKLADPVVNYNENEHTFVLRTHGSAWTYYYFYKLKGMKTTKIASYKTYKHYTGSTSDDYELIYKINGKKVSEKQFDSRLKKALKGYKEFSLW